MDATMRDIEYIAIVAHTPNLGIGYNGSLPWPRLNEDMRRFKETTENHVVVMGSRTFESIGDKLPNRLNVVFTRNSTSGGDILVTSIQEFDKYLPALLKYSRRIFICGGASIYELFANRLTHIMSTRIDINFKSNTFFPNIRFTPFSSSDVIEESGIRYQFIEGYINNSRQDTTNSEDMQVLNEAISRYPNVEEIEYLKLLNRILTTGEKRENRTGISTLSISGAHLEFSLENGRFPLLTTKRTFLRGIAEELIWFLSGKCHTTDYLLEKNVHIWDGNSSREYLDKVHLEGYRVGEIGPIYGWTWRHYGAKYQGPDHDYTGEGIDQIAEVIRLIKEDPNSRRILFHGWNPSALSEMALPPCHILYMFYVHTNGKLDCHMVQRSCDSFLGLPFNIASTALLTRVIAHVTNKKPGKIRISLNDVHIYENHIEQVQSQLSRRPNQFPRLDLSDEIHEIEDLTWDRIELSGYTSHGPIKASMAI